VYELVEGEEIIAQTGTGTVGSSVDKMADSSQSKLFFSVFSRCEGPVCSSCLKVLLVSFCVSPIHPGIKLKIRFTPGIK